jgi:hypothetical protein
VLVVVLPPASDPDAVVEWLVRFGAGTPYDAKQKLLKGTPFLLECGDTAGEWAGHFREAGLDAWMITDDAAALPRLFDVHNFAISDDALTAIGFTGDSFVVPWSTVQLVARARKDAPPPKPMQKVDPKAQKAAEHEVLYVSASDAFLRFELGRVDYVGLGERRTAVVRQNHVALVAEVEARAHAFGARVDASLEALAGKLPPLPRGPAAAGRLGVDGTEGAFHEAVVLMAMAERARRG